MANRNFHQRDQFSDPETVAIEALGYLAADPQRLMRFLSLTGLEPESVRDAARAPGFFASVMDYVVGDEALLIACAETLGKRPEHLVAAQRALSPHRDLP
jgi:hypothetical protein